MYISLHLTWFHENHIKYIKRKPPLNNFRKNEFKRESNVQFVNDRAGAEPEVFQDEAGCLKFADFDKHFIKNTRKKDPAGKKFRDFFT